MLDDYKTTGFDEMLAADGQVRPQWRTLLDGLAAMGSEGRAAAQEATKRQLRESGIAFNVYADPDDRAHAWRLDMMPVVLPTPEWRELEQGLIQRARMIDAVLADLYGPQKLLRSGRLPPAMLLGAPEFVRASVSAQGEQQRFLHSYSCDIARTADGGWIVLGDQVDTAIGNGYALASRVALSHGLATIFRDSHTRRLAGYYMTLQESLQGLAGREDGRIVVMSPGPDNPSYFSHSYLARYLGFTLAEAADLTVRDNHLYLKTLHGLQRVDVLVRKSPGHIVDPLHLPGSGLRGIPGLLEAARSGRVTLVNGAGAGVVQNRALAAFEDVLAREILGEDLLLRSPETLWLGDRQARERLLVDPVGQSVMPATARNDPGEPCEVTDLDSQSRAKRAELLARLDREGHRWVATRPTPLASTPAYDGDRLVPVHWAVRTYLVATADGYAVLPGGLVRMAGPADRAAVLPNGHGSKDLWITADSPERRPPSILSATIPTVHLRRTGRDLLSRTADNLYWLGRYVERAENQMRMLRSVLSRLLEDGRPENDSAILRRLLATELAKGPDLPSSVVPGWGEIEYLAGVLMLESRDYGLRETLDNVQRTATLARDQISHDAWRMLNQLHIDRRWRQSRQKLQTTAALDLLDDGVRVLNAFAGTEAENMTRNWAWRFLEMGRRIERSTNLVDLIREAVIKRAEPELDGALRLLLELGDSFMTYRSRYLMTPLTAPVLDLLILDESNPRGIAYQLKAIDSHLASLPNEGPHRSPEQRVLLRLLTDVRLAEVVHLAERRADRSMPFLDQLLDSLADGLPRISQIIATSYFAHAEIPVVTQAARKSDPAP